MKPIFTQQAKLGIQLFTVDFQIILCLYFDGLAQSHELLRQIATSPANFQIVLKRLRDSGKIEYHDQADDGRVRTYRLPQGVRDEVSMLFDSFDHYQSRLKEHGSIR